ncbi:ASCH domain-containing protein [Leptospira ognonensis]|uniref:ASCH domain-containing protein n=1 Tax=Leptospira ognonensis TaxID=2484945 RepID=A0A4R9K0Q3_9LEPT|nr:ASCH domain-containing protein [Leptospira ognonensis]TGL58691.1 ASCH domain-containing protein [Leptospira ognonensis]
MSEVKKKKTSKALSIRQPWAYLIVNRYKDIENRSWSTSFRGKVLIHAGKKFETEAYYYVLKKHKISLPPIEEFELGGIVGEAEIVDCVEKSKSKWFGGPYGFVLKNAKRKRFIPLKGQLGFFNVEV